MKQKIGFDGEKYIKEQSKSILERMSLFKGKLYLEFGGKITYDYHASRVLPGYDPNTKVRLLQSLKKETEVLLCISSIHIEKRKLRGDFGTTYDVELLRIMKELQEWGLYVSGVVMTCFQEQEGAVIFRKKLRRKGIKVYTHKYTRGYPTDIDLVVSEKGYGANDYIPTTKRLVVVAGVGPGSGKLATALSQLYHDNKKGKKTGYAKFETFPVWDLPLKHPLNIAYEVATADIGDYNLIDPFHFQENKKVAVNYNRDVEVFPVLKRIMEKIMGKDSVYKSPTEMGVNKCKVGIVNDKVIQEACFQEVIRRYFRHKREYNLGLVEKDVVQKIELAMKEMNITPEDRKVVLVARKAMTNEQKKKKGDDGFFCGAAIMLPSGELISGKNSPFMHATSSMILNAVKVMSGIPDKVYLLSPEVVESVTAFNKNILKRKSVGLNLKETLIALSISATSDENAKIALEKLSELQGCEVHTTNILTNGDESALRQLKVNVTSDSN
ncbi:MAG: DUF1846 family protein [Patescibacteria group bacterium]|jgi:uncharacterized protein (UPF0371 family)|nr:DUF1846 family protein [Patescibacteria group bacterium]